MDTVLISPQGRFNEDIKELNPIISISSNGPIDSAPIDSPQDALESLRSQPDLDRLTETLRWLSAGIRRKHDFDITEPSPKAAQIIFVLVNEIVPHIWPILSTKGSGINVKARKSLIECLRSVAGIGAVVSQIRSCLSSSNKAQSSAKSTNLIHDSLEIIERILEGDTTLISLWVSLHDKELSASRKSLQWKELISLVASGKLLSICSEASKSTSDGVQHFAAGKWVADGSEYAAWLGRNIASTIKAHHDMESPKYFAQLLSKAFSLGYTGQHSRKDVHIWAV